VGSPLVQQRREKWRVHPPREQDGIRLELRAVVDPADWKPAVIELPIET